MAKALVVAFALWTSLQVCAADVDAGGAVQRFCAHRPGGEVLMRTELFFGLARPDGGAVSEGDFQAFVDREVTPRFPSGFTLHSGRGQFRNAAGAIEREGSKLLILLYGWSEASSRNADDIRATYKRLFDQQSVLRIDQLSCASF